MIRSLLEFKRRYFPRAYRSEMLRRNPAEYARLLVGDIMATHEVVMIHDPASCEGQPCCFHNPSDHPLNDRETNIRFDRPVYVDGIPQAYLTERICEHGIGHPDPDSLAYLMKIGASEYEGVHGCDGCCRRKSVTAERTYESHDGVEQIRLSTGHEITFGGQGDGFCYAHQSFDCIDNLNEDEKKALKNV